MTIENDKTSTGNPEKKALAGTKNKVIYTVGRKNDQPNEFFKVLKPETADARAGCIPFNSIVFLLAKSALEMNCYLLILSFSVLTQTAANIYYHNCADCYGFYHLTHIYSHHP